MSALTRCELALVIESLAGERGALDLDHLMKRMAIGRHPARLNLVDCAAYALATTLAQPLLYTGDDFAHTDIARVRY